MNTLAIGSKNAPPARKIVCVMQSILVRAASCSAAAVLPSITNLYNFKLSSQKSTA
jgi:hypothetical protein